IHTIAPCWANNNEIAFPIPLPPPVTMATLLSNLSMLFIVYDFLKRRRADTGPAPVNNYVLSGDVLCFIRYQKKRGMGDVGGVGRPAHRRDVGPSLFIIRILHGSVG